jgi:hypothetical protein
VRDWADRHAGYEDPASSLSVLTCVGVSRLVSESGGDRARAAADIEHVRRRRQPREQVGRGILGGPPSMRPQHAVVVAVQVGLRGLWHVPMVSAGRNLPALVVTQAC